MDIKVLPRYFQLILGVKRDERLGFSLVTKVAKRLTPEFRFTWPELAWFRNRRLNEVLARFDEADGFNAHRRFALGQLVRLTAGVPGDTAECGVFQGCGSYIILATSANGLPRTHHIFDSFAGLSAPTGRDGDFWGENDLSVDEAITRRNLREFQNVRYYKGWIPDRFAEVAGCTFSFVHVDVDLYEPTRQSIQFFYDRLNPGAIFVCDDYGFLTCPGATSAIDEFLESKPEKMVSLSGGGGFFVKGTVTSHD